MQVTTEATRFKDLHHRTQSRVPTTDDNARVFIARSGTRIVGTAAVTHRQNGYDRALVVDIDANTRKARTQLLTTVKQSLAPLHRRVVFN